MTAIQPLRPMVRPLPYYEPDGFGRQPELELELPTPAPPSPPPPALRTLAEAAARSGAQVLLRLMLEVLDGRRPAAHLAAAVTGPVLRYVTAAGGALQGVRTAQRSVAAARLRTLRLSLPRDEVAEVSAVCQLRGRVRALAVRIELDERSPLGWRCTALRLA